MIELTTKEKIILVVKESVKYGYESCFTYNTMFEKHKDVSRINRLRDTMKEKIELLKNLDENSHLFKSILITARKTLDFLKTKEEYNFHSAELLLKMYALEDIFKKKLRPIGVRIIDQTEKQKTNSVLGIKSEVNISFKIDNKEIQEQEVSNENEIVYDENEQFEKLEELQELNGKLIDSEMSGQKLQKINKQQKDFKQAVLNSLND